MIGRLSGILLEKNPPHLLLDCHGVGYEIDAPMSTFYQMPAIGEPLVLLTHLIVRADAHALYGFASAPAGIAGGALTSAHGADILNALLALGYSEKEALAAIQAIPADSDVSD